MSLGFQNGDFKYELQRQQYRMNDTCTLSVTRNGKPVAQYRCQGHLDLGGLGHLFQ